METKYPHLFSPYTIKKITFRNRIFATPAMSAWPEYDGGPSINCLYDSVARAKGGCAVVTMGETSINRHDAVRMNTIFLTQEDHLKGSVITPTHLHGKLAEAINRHGAVASIQLYHAGETADDFLSGGNVWGPMSYTKPDGTKVTAMDEEKMQKVCDDFENAARIAVMCGYQMIQLHGGHGWLLSQFLSPLTNHRTDEYGGSLENRAKFPIRIIEAVRRGAGPDTILELRTSGEEHVEGGMHIEELTEFIKMVQDKIDIVHISAGCFYSSPQYMFPSIFQEHGLNVANAAYMKAHVDIPVSVVGGLSDPAQMEQIIAEGKADFVCMTRQLFADADLPIKAYEGLEEDIKPCIRCSNCLGLKGTSHHGCDVNPLAANGSFLVNSIQPVRQQRRVLVVGGGPGGMTAAITACDRGHEVILIDKADALGGALRHADEVPFKADLKQYKDYLVRQVEKRDIDVRLNTPVTEELIDELAPDRVIAAVGARPIEPAFEGIETLPHVNALQAHSNVDSLGERVVVIGGGLVGCETAIYLRGLGKDVTIVEMLEEVARDANGFYFSAIMEQIGDLGIDVLRQTRCESFQPDGVLVVGPSGESELLPCDCAVISVGMRPNRETVEMLRNKVGFARFRDIGDCVTPAFIRQAVHHGYFAATDIV